MKGEIAWDMVFVGIGENRIGPSKKGRLELYSPTPGLPISPFIYFLNKFDPYHSKLCCFKVRA
jgi:hypothetical protein